MESNPIPKWLPTVAFFIGVVALGVVLFLVFQFNSPNNLQITTIRTVTALGGAAFAMAFTGFLSLKLNFSRTGYIVAGGSLGVFVVLYFFTPQILGGNNQLEVLQNRAIDEIRTLNKVVTTAIDDKSDIDQEKISELVAYYKFRADEVSRKLTEDIKYAPVEEYLSIFNSLHDQHISALESSRLVLAAAVLRQIHELSRKLDGDEFWIKHKIEHPEVAYSMCPDAFSRGELSNIYAGSLTTEALAVQSGTTSGCLDYELTQDQIARSTDPNYLYGELVLKQKPPN